LDKLQSDAARIEQNCRNKQLELAEVEKRVPELQKQLVANEQRLRDEIEGVGVNLIRKTQLLNEHRVSNLGNLLIYYNV
jgi:hypothetical protein